MASPAETSQRDLLVPVLNLAQGPPDPVALSTWHMALSNLVGTEISHQLLGLWVFPERGGVILLGPEALAQDGVAVPIPTPFLAQDQLFELEETLRRARYASAVAVPVRAANRDVGVLLLGTFDPGAYGPSAVRTIAKLAERLESSLTTLGKLLISGGTRPSYPDDASLSTIVAELANEAPSGPELVRRLSGLLHPQIPHDRLEILVFAGGQRTALPLSGLSGRRRWGAGSTSWSDLAKLMEEMLGDDDTGTIANLPSDAPGLSWPGGGAAGSGPTRIASVIAAKLKLGGERIGLLVVGHVSQGLYRPADEAVLAEVSTVLAARVVAFRFETEAHALRGQLEVLQAPSLPVLRAAESLAGTAHLGEALHKFEREIQEIVPHDQARYLLRVAELEVVEFTAGTLRPLGDLQALAIEDSPAKAVLDEGRPWSLEYRDAGEQLVVALRVADRVIGALLLEASHFESAREAAAAAQQFAAILSPHLELVRRSAAPRMPPKQAGSPNAR